MKKRMHGPLIDTQRPAKDLLLTAYGIVIGCAAALVAVAYRFALSEGEKARDLLFGTADTPMGTVGMFLALALLGYVTGRLTESEPMIRGSGIPQLEGEMKGHFDMNWFPVLIKKFIGGALCAAGGLSVGREGPSIQLGSMTGKGISRGMKEDRGDEKYLVVCGACAGLAAAFNAPFAGVVFAIEEIHKNISRRSLMPAFAAAVSADVVSKLFFSVAPTLYLGTAPVLPMNFYPLCLVLGIVTGFVGTGYNAGLLFVQKLYRKTKLPLRYTVMIPFLVSGIMYFVYPEVLGSGHGIFLGVASGKYLLGGLLLLLAVKYMFSMVSFCSGAPGGIFFPLLVLGALTGAASAQILGVPAEYLLIFVVAGMAGIFSSIVRAPLTGVVLVLEMTGSMNQLICLAICSAASMITSELLGSRPIYDSLLENMTAKEE